MAFGRAPSDPHTTDTPTTTHHASDRNAVVNPLLFLSNIFVWLSSVIVMSIAAYEIDDFKKYTGGSGFPGDRIVYILVIGVLTIVFSLVTFVLYSRPRYNILLNLIFSHLWLVSVVFVAEDYSNRHVRRVYHGLEAFTFIAFFGLLFNILCIWWQWYRAAPRTTPVA
jgi:hypothetical protein